MTGLYIADLAIRASKLQNSSNIPVNCCIECGLFPRSLMESTIAGAGFAGERRTLGSNDDYRLKTSQVISQSFDETIILSCLSVLSSNTRKLNRADILKHSKHCEKNQSNSNMVSTLRCQIKK